MREKMIELLEEYIEVVVDLTGEPTIEVNYGECAAELIANGVTIQKHGHWILDADSILDPHTGEYYDEFYMECSECGRKIWDFDPYAIAVLKTHPYCNCGAKMDSVQRGGGT